MSMKNAIMMATQTTKVISELTLSHGVIEQMRVRFGMKCGEDDVRYLYGGRNDVKILEMMKGPIGTAVMNLEYMEANSVGFRAAYCSDELQRSLLSTISEQFADYPYTMQIFEGNRTVSLVDYLTQNNIGFSEDNLIKIYMGTLIKVAPPFVFQFDKRRRHNMLICGANEKMAENITNLITFSALLNINTDVYNIDGECLIGESVSASFYECMTNFQERFKSATNRTDIIKFINDVYSIYTERKKNNENKQTLVVIKNIQFLDIVKTMLKGDSIDESEFVSSDEVEKVPEAEPEKTEGFNFFGGNSYSSSSVSVSDKLIKLVEDGSNYGIYFIVSSLEFQSVKENMYYGVNSLAKFPERIVFSLSNNDADSLIDGVAVTGIRDNTVFFTDGVKSAFQFKPYIMPDVEILNDFIKRLNASE